MSLYKNITIASSIIEGKFDYYDELLSNKFCKLYPFTTENIEGYYKELDFFNKKILTVGSSADQILNAISKNSYIIDCFDFNPLVKYYYNLKKTAINCFEKEEFLEFFCYKNYPSKNEFNEESFSFKKYIELRFFLDLETKAFFDYLYLNYSPKDIRKNLFMEDETSKIKIENINNYLDDNEYILMKGKLKKANVRFFNFNINNLNKSIDNDYDYIFLSNISSYLEMIYPWNHIENYQKDIQTLEKHLNENGKIFIAYLYDYDKYIEHNKNKKIIFNLDKVYEVFGKEKLTISKFKSIISFEQEKECEDAVLIYHK